MNTKFEEALLRLNKEQLEAVQSIEGPVVVVAGPGTGKTQIIALRIGNILKQTQVDPYNILALTFTQSGAVAMTERLVSLIGPAGYDVAIYTFHAFCGKVIEDFPEKFSFKKELRTVDDIGKHEIVREIIDQNSFEFLVNPMNKFMNVGDIISSISKLKKENISEAKLREYLVDKFKELQDEMPDEGAKKGVIKKYNSKHKSLRKLEELLVVYAKYQEELVNKSLYDFDDMILFVLNQFKADPDLLLHYQEKYQYILADEFQDSNNSQTELLDMLCSYFEENPNLFVVGDDDQSIYRFQGASIENFNSFFDKYPSAKRIILKENYRSTQLILDASKSVIQNNQQRVASDKDLHSNSSITETRIELSTFSVEMEESAFVVNKCKQLIENGVNPSEISIIARKNRYILELSHLFQKSGVPYSVSAGNNVIDNKYLRKIISILKVLNNPEDLVEFNKVFFLPHLNISISDIMNFNKAVREHKLTNILLIPVKGKEGPISDLIRKMTNWYMQFGLEPFPRAFMSMLVDLGIIDYLGLSLDRLEDFDSLNSFISFVNSLYHKDPELTLAKMISIVDSIIDHNITIEEKMSLAATNSVQLMTAHKSKGLEFEYVFLPNCTNSAWNKDGGSNKNVIPKDLVAETFESEKDAEEELRRLFYVALTRAKKHIYISLAQNYDSASRLETPSKFISEIDPELINTVVQEPLKQSDLVAMMTASTGTEYFVLKEKNKIKELVKNNFRLSASALNTYLRCKKTFFMNYILKTPSVSNLSMIQGNLVHRMLEIYLPKQGYSVEELDASIAKFVDRQILSDKDKQILAVSGKEIFVNWFSDAVNQQNLPKPLYSEYDSSSKNIVVEGVPITGKIDMIELLNAEAREVRVTDFKTSAVKSMNVIKGISGEEGPAIYYQLMFYKLMVEADKSLKYTVPQGAVAFLKPNDSGYFKTEYITFNQEDLDNFKQVLINVYSGIINLNFLDFDEECKCKECPFNYI